MSLWEHIESNLNSSSLLQHNDSTYSYKQLISLSTEISSSLKAYDKGSIISHHCDSPLLTLAGLMACLKSGIHFLPIFEKTTPAEIDSIYKKIPVTAALDNTGSLTRFEDSAPKLEREPGIIFQSSGSTGPSKFIHQSQANLLGNAKIAAKYQGLKTDSKIFMPLTLSHTGGLNMQTLPGLIQGASITFSSRVNVKALSLLLENNFTHTVLVPNHLNRFVERTKDESLDLNLLILTGSCPVSKVLLQKVITKNIDIISIYGLTEMGPFSCVWDSRLQNINDIADRCFIIGQSIEDFSLKLNDNNEIMLSGPHQGQYVSFNNKQWQLKSCGNEWFNTGDLGFYKDDQYYYSGRKNRQINLAGFKINPEEVEEYLNQHPQVIESHIYPVDDTLWNQVPHIDLVISGDIKEFQLKEYLAQRFTSLKIPKKWNFIDKLGKTSIYKTNIKREKP